MDTLKDTLLEQLRRRSSLEPTPIAPDLQDIRLPLGFLKMRLDNWKTARVRKVNMMRCTVVVPKLEIFAIELYPDADFDVPMLAIDFSCMKKKSFIYMNFIPLFPDADYYERYIARLQPIKDRYGISPAAKPKEWMHPYLHDSSIYAMAGNDQLEGARACAAAYLSCYLELLDRAEPISDPAYRDRVEKAATHYCDQLSEKDGSRKMLGRFIGMDRANRIFRDVIR